MPGVDLILQQKEGESLKGSSARIWRCRPDGTGLESMCGGGYDNAIELVFMPSGETIGTMTYFIDPQGGLRDALCIGLKEAYIRNRKMLLKRIILN